MDDEWDNASKFNGINSELNQSSDIVKIVKLVNYRKAITNFVKIVSKKDLPVIWAGDNSYTDGKAVVLSTNIKDSNFDVTVGLALHEASHIVLTDFSILPDLHNGNVSEVEELIDKHLASINSAIVFSRTTIAYAIRRMVKEYLNWVEDRRIDHFIFSTSPGYKAYYHKLYDNYWNAKDIHKGFVSQEFCDKTNIDHYCFHIINMINPNFNKKALPGLEDIVKIVDLKNIARLKDTKDALAVAIQIVDVILEQAKPWDDTQPQDADKQPSNSEDDQSTNIGSAGAGSGGTDDDDDDDIDDNDADRIDETPLTPAQVSAIRRAFETQRKFLSGEIGKKQATKKMQQQLTATAKQDIGMQTVGDETVGHKTGLIYDFTKSNTLSSVFNLLEQKTELERQKDELVRLHGWGSKEISFLNVLLDSNQTALDAVGYDREIFTSRLIDLTDENSTYGVAIQDGLSMGAVLGKRLQLHNESRERVDNRLRSGRIDSKRLAHAGYDMENVFKQIHIDKYKKANIHISLDGSGSMNGGKWAAALQMTTAIAKAASYTQNINIQVSIRVTQQVSRGDTPTTIYIYDSRKNKLNHLINGLRMVIPSSMTPEGLCFETIYKERLLVQNSSELDSYFLNISDGEPGCTGYHGLEAQDHTRNIVNKIKTGYGIQMLSFFLSGGISSDNDENRHAKLMERFMSSSSGQAFRRMYGRDASVVDPNSAVGIAKELNKKFLTKAQAKHIE